MINTIVEAGVEAVAANSLNPFFNLKEGINPLRQEVNATSFPLSRVKK